MDPGPHLHVNPDLDRDALARRFRDTGRVQVAAALTDASARSLHTLLSRDTPWGLAWQAGADGPHVLRSADLSVERRQKMAKSVGAAMARSDYAFAFAQYPMLMAYQERWSSGGPHDRLLEQVNGPALLDLARAITGVPALMKADAQATLFGPGHFLSTHDDLGNEGEARRIAYVLSLCDVAWRPDWGGQLLFLDERDDVIEGINPRFNTLSLFSVGQRHLVSAVAPYAPLARYAITGWFRDR